MTYPSDKDIIKLLSKDPLENAEKITGEDIDGDKATMSLGSVINVHNDMMKDKTLKAVGDTVFHMDWLAYCDMIETFGFGLMMEDYSPDGGAFLRIYYHEKDGLLLRADSHHGNRNSAKVYYNWKPNFRPKAEWKNPEKPEFASFLSLTESGGIYPRDAKIEDTVWAGNHDAREALSFNLRKLRENGTFVPKWKKRPSLWLVGHWEEADEAVYDRINRNRIAKLPQWVQDNIKGI